MGIFGRLLSCLEYGHRQHKGKQEWLLSNKTAKIDYQPAGWGLAESQSRTAISKYVKREGFLWVFFGGYAVERGLWSSKLSVV